MVKDLSRPALIAYNGYDVGLGNRIRVVLGSMSLAELEGRAFYYVWPTGTLFGPRFEDLWHFEGTVVPRALSRLLAKRWGYVDHNTPTWLNDEKRTERLWQIRTGSELVLPPGARSWKEEFRSLVPAPEIATRVNTIYDDHLRDRPYIGVNIRAHAVSHAVTRDASPVEWYVERLTEISREWPDVRFFISCDVPEVQEMISAQIPGCFGQVDKGGYNTLEGVRSSVVDLYLLASAGYLIGPHYSSFVHLAEYLNGEVLDLETSATGTPEPVDFAKLASVADPLKPHERADQPA